MNFTKLIQPKSNPFRLFIYSPYHGSIILKSFASQTSQKLSSYNTEEGTYCNSYNNLYLSSGNSFWIINHNSYQIRYKNMPITKKNHSMIFVSNAENEGKIFIVGGNDKKTFFYDLKKNYFINWAETNELHIKPSLIQIDDYLYLFDTIEQNQFSFERTDLTNNGKKWEKINPLYDPNLIINFPSTTFASCLDSTNTHVIFLGGNNINISNNYTYLYDIKNNKIILSNKGTNDNMNFKDKNFYFIDNKYSIALPDSLEENKEIALIDKIEQSLIKININEKSNKNYIFSNNNICQNCLNGLEQNNNYSINSINKQKNLNPTKKINKVNIKELPKEFGYCVSGHSIEEAKIKAKKDNIEIIEINHKFIQNNIKKEIKEETKEELKEENNEIRKENLSPNNQILLANMIISENNKQDEQNLLGQNIEENIVQKEEINNIEEQNVDFNNNENIHNNIQYEEINTDIKQNENINENLNEENNNNIIEDNEYNEEPDQIIAPVKQNYENIQKNIEEKEKVIQPGNEEEHYEENSEEPNEEHYEEPNIEDNINEVKENVEEEHEHVKEEQEQKPVQEYNKEEHYEENVEGEYIEGQMEENNEQEHVYEDAQEEEQHYEEEVENIEHQENNNIDNNELKEIENTENIENIKNVEKNKNEQNENITELANEQEQENNQQIEQEEVINEKIEINEENENLEENLNVQESQNVEEIPAQEEEQHEGEFIEASNKESKRKEEEGNIHINEDIKEKIKEGTDITEEDAKIHIQMQNQLKFNNDQIQMSSANENEINNNQTELAQNQIEENKNNNMIESNEVLTSQEQQQIINEEEIPAQEIHKNEEEHGEVEEGNQFYEMEEDAQEVQVGEGGDEIHHPEGEEIQQINENEEGGYIQNEENVVEEHEEHEEMYEENKEEMISSGEYYHKNIVEKNNIEGEEMYDGEEQEEERDTLRKTLTQEIGEDVLQIQEFPNHIYYKKENFCDYKP